MQYADIFSFPEWETIAISILQTATLFFLVLVGLRLIGRRVLGERSPQDLVIIVLVAEACDLGLSHEKAGYWGTFASVLTIFLLGYLTERIALLRRIFHEKPVVLYNDGHLHRNIMRKNMVDEEDLLEVAREAGFSSYKSFKKMTLESDGQISAVFTETKE